MDPPTISNKICNDYKCYMPTPRSAFAKDGSPLCAGLGEFLYDPANCDPGYWCGCSSSDPSRCFPSNDIESGSLWGGHFTVKNETSGQEIVLTGWFDGIGNKCPQSYYCPGNTELFRCVDLCEPGKICPDSSSMKECPEGKFCPVGSTVPQECHGLELCEGSGKRRFGTGSASAVILAYLVLSITGLYYARHVINKRARTAKHSKKAPQEETEATDEGPEQAVPESLRDSMYFVPSGPLMQARKSFSVSSPQTKVDIEFENLRLTLPNVGTIMRDVSGKLTHGKLTAVMGPSGAGKTTFLSLMSGKIDRSGGTVRVNGEETELTRYRKIIGYVPQDDTMLRELTVEENVTHSALMRLPLKWTKEKKLAQVDEILKALEIDHVRDMVVGDEKRRGISGGQRKRVNIAMEMVTKPSLLCLDEPTSGLDSTASFTVIRSLKDMVASGANIVSVIHQPKHEVFALFDEVLLLGRGGMTVYYGPTAGMAAYFEKRGFPCPAKANPADFYMDVLTGIVPHATNFNFMKEDLFEDWMVSEENPNCLSLEAAKAQAELLVSQFAQEEIENQKVGPIRRFCVSVRVELLSLANHLTGDGIKKGKVSTRKVPGPLKQAFLLLKRACLQRLRTPNTTVMNIVLMAIAGAVIPSLVPGDATLYVGIPKSLIEPGSDDYQAYLRQNVNPVDEIPGILINVWLFLLIVSCLSVNVLGGNERLVFFRETATGQSVFSYWIAKTLETILWLPAYTSAFVLLGYSSDAWLLQPMGTYWVFTFLTLVGLYGFGMVASLLVGGGSAALLSLVFGIIVCISFSGAVNAYGDASAGYQKFINFWFLFWSTQGIVAKEYEQYGYAFDVELLNAQTPDLLSTDFGTGENVVGAGIGMGFDLDSSYGRNVGFCALTAFAWHLLVLWTLKTRNHRKHR